MLKIRKNIFETNSSSVHAICIDSNPVDTHGLAEVARLWFIINACWW